MDNHKTLQIEQANLESIKENLDIAESERDSRAYTILFKFYMKTMQNVRRLQDDIQGGVRAI